MIRWLVLVAGLTCLQAAELPPLERGDWNRPDPDPAVQLSAWDPLPPNPAPVLARMEGPPRIEFSGGSPMSLPPILFDIEQQGKGRETRVLPWFGAGLDQAALISAPEPFASLAMAEGEALSGRLVDLGLHAQGPTRIEILAVPLGNRSNGKPTILYQAEVPARRNPDDPVDLSGTSFSLDGFEGRMASLRVDLTRVDTGVGITIPLGGILIDRDLPQVQPFRPDSLKRNDNNAAIISTDAHWSIQAVDDLAVMSAELMVTQDGKDLLRTLTAPLTYDQPSGGRKWIEIPYPEGLVLGPARFRFRVQDLAGRWSEAKEMGAIVLPEGYQESSWEDGEVRVRLRGVGGPRNQRVFIQDLRVRVGGAERSLSHWRFKELQDPDTGETVLEATLAARKSEQQDWLHVEAHIGAHDPAGGRLVTNTSFSVR